VSDLLPFRIQPAPVRDGVDIRELVLDVCASLAEECAAQEIVIDVDIPFGETVLIDRHSLRQVVQHVVQRALRSMPDGGELTFSSFRTGHCLELEIADTGPGFPVEPRYLPGTVPGRFPGTRVQSPWDAVAQLLAQTGGALRLENCPQGGAAVTLQIPCRILRAAA
jgi:K+-sensing histidine kinase KdpD